MEYSVDAPELAGHRVVVELPSSLFGTPRLLLDGAPVEKKDGAYSVPGANGEPVVLRLKTAGLDALPIVQIGENQRTIRLAPAFRWYEYVWSCLPLVLVLMGGILGGGLGAGAAYTNLAIFRTRSEPAARYGLSAAVTVAVFVVYAVIAALLHPLIASKTPPAAH